MSIKLGSTSVDALYLGESGYGLANVVKVYLDSTIVWPVADMVVSGITDGNATALNGDYTTSGGTVNSKNFYTGPSLSSPPSNLSGRTICMYTVPAHTSGYYWVLGFETSGGVQVDSGYYFYAAATSSLSPPSSGWSPKSLTGSVTVVVNN